MSFSTKHQKKFSIAKSRSFYNNIVSTSLSSLVLTKQRFILLYIRNTTISQGKRRRREGRLYSSRGMGRMCKVGREISWNPKTSRGIASAVVGTGGTRGSRAERAYTLIHIIIYLVNVELRSMPIRI